MTGGITFLIIVLSIIGLIEGIVYHIDLVNEVLDLNQENLILKKKLGRD